MRKMIVLTLVLISLLMAVNTAAAVQPLRVITVEFSDESILVCRVGAETGSLMVNGEAGSAPCDQGYDLNGIIRIRVNGRQVGLNPYLGLTQFTPTLLDEQVVNDHEGQVG